MLEKKDLQLRKRTAPGASTRSFAGRTDIPLVSILTVCRNAQDNIRQCIESVLTQDYPRIEYIIQDGNSSDDTLKIIAEYGDRIKVVSKVDTPNKANYWGIERCTGDILGMCWSDEELLPGAISWGVEQLLNRPSAGGIFGDVLATDGEGAIYPHQKPNSLKWDIKKCLCWEIIPNYCSSFFRRSALQKAGFFKYDENKHCCMYDYYAKVGVHFPIHYVPGFVAKFAMHKNQLSSGSQMLQSLVDMIEASYDALISELSTPAWVKELEPRLRAGIRLAMLPSLINNAKDYQTAFRLLKQALTFKPDKKFIQRVCPPLLQTLLESDEYEIVANLCDELESQDLLSDEMGLPKAQVFFKLGRYDDAYKCITHTLKHLPFDAAAQMMFVELLEKRRLSRPSNIIVDCEVVDSKEPQTVFNPGALNLADFANLNQTDVKE